jgi:hypothetical protein
MISQNKLDILPKPEKLKKELLRLQQVVNSILASGAKPITGILRKAMSEDS